MRLSKERARMISRENMDRDRALLYPFLTMAATQPPLKGAAISTVLPPSMRSSLPHQLPSVTLIHLSTNVPLAFVRSRRCDGCQQDVHVSSPPFQAILSETRIQRCGPGMREYLSRGLVSL